MVAYWRDNEMSLVPLLKYGTRVCGCGNFARFGMCINCAEMEVIHGVEALCMFCRRPRRMGMMSCGTCVAGYERRRRNGKQK
jgi:hypothetical protein